MSKERRVFTKEFKEQAVLLTETSGKNVSQIAKDLGIPENNLWRWKKEVITLVVQKYNDSISSSGGLRV